MIGGREVTELVFGSETILYFSDLHFFKYYKHTLTSDYDIKHSLYKHTTARRVDIQLLDK